ncbi:hypothetical protein SERLA73DRAFT_174570 [Serpula lacrymans var. lacrymans S7.3]|uniref:Uncharacterized protein n=2 Tax=Serpula lacrymans var. lacrymans TaxID=341189 RepID=F8PGJ3_SERL3|nr:uncharacterized protein SERLADRAFT_456168 [Serpula lacrymans var. lacrymans S7.9]EGO05426.1 hypothetical protein SERLA73DRAFT_174570 [Serpula lacrymans var. lacrymans S7.3]EGO31273.1 hypothetical protein SERLADRAFT_456168 [Serpula lacrymans var. lacrymans S7.9]
METSTSYSHPRQIIQPFTTTLSSSLSCCNSYKKQPSYRLHPGFLRLQVGLEYRGHQIH